MRIINTFNKYGSRNKWARSKTFCAGITIKMLFQLLKQGKNSCFLPWQKCRYNKAWLYFTRAGHDLLSQIYWCKILSVGDKDLLEKSWEMLLVVHLSFLHRTQLLMKILFENQQTYANLLLGLMPVNYTPTGCVKPCRPVFISVGISIQKRVHSHLDKTRPAAWRIWSCPISNEQDQNVKLSASLQQAERRKLTASVLMGFVLIGTLFLKPLIALTTSVPLRSCVPLPLKKLFNVVARGESSIHWDDSIYKRKVTRLLKCGSANGGGCTNQPLLLNNISENTFPTDVHLQLSNL